MKRPQREDIISILAIGFGATLSFGITAAFFEERGAPLVGVEVQTYQVRSRAPGPTMVIPDGYRAVTVATDDVTAVAGWVRPGSRVDVMVTLEDADVEPTTRVFLRDVLVLGNDRSITREGDGRAVQQAFVTLVLTPEDAQTLTEASTNGQVRFAVRNTPLAPSLLSR